MIVEPPPAAIVYIPPDIPGDALCAHQGVAHIARRGYRLAGVLRDPDHVRHILTRGLAEIVVFASRTHSVDWAGLAREFVGEETRRLAVRSNRRDPTGSLANEIAAYRSGYADGFVDSVTLRRGAR